MKQKQTKLNKVISITNENVLTLSFNFRNYSNILNEAADDIKSGINESIALSIGSTVINSFKNLKKGNSLLFKIIIE